MSNVLRPKKKQVAFVVQKARRVKVKRESLENHLTIWCKRVEYVCMCFPSDLCVLPSPCFGLLSNAHGRLPACQVRDSLIWIFWLQLSNTHCWLIRIKIMFMWTQFRAVLFCDTGSKHYRLTCWTNSRVQITCTFLNYTFFFFYRKLSQIRTGFV